MTSRFLFVPLMQRGHTNQLIGIMQRLQREGHALAVFGSPRRHIAEQFRNAGITCRWFPEEEEEQVDPPRALLGSRLQTLGFYRRWYWLGVHAVLNERRISEVRRAIREFAATVVCADALSYDACIAAQIEGVPWAVAAALLMSAASPSWRFPFKDIADEARPEIARMAASLGAPLELTSTDVISPWLNVLFTTEELVPRSISGNRRSWYVGVSRPLDRRGDEPEFPWEKLRDDVPLVYVASGGGHALSYDAETYIKITSALGADEAQYVCSLGELARQPFVRDLPENVIAVSYAPQLQLLERRASVVVSHGGINSVNEALTYGRPLLVIPISHDQPLQARAIERSGAGLALSIADLSVRTCRDALLALLREHRYRDAACRIRDSYGRNDGAAATADLLCRLARERKPIPPPDLVEPVRPQGGSVE